MLGETLQSIRELGVAMPEFELLVIDNNSPDATHEVVSAFQTANPELSVRYIHEATQGLSHARNRGIHESKAPWILFLDDDVNCDPGLLKAYQVHLSQTDASAFGGRILPHFEGERPRWLNRFLLPAFAVLDLGTRSKRMPANNYPMGANMLISKESLAGLGGFNTNLGRQGTKLEAGEEKDLFERLRAAGKSIGYTGEALVHHRIPEKRTQWAYLRRQGLGTGRSAWILAGGAKGRTVVLLKELGKWLATVVLFFGYLLLLRPQASWMLVRFRAMVTFGLLSH